MIRTTIPEKNNKYFLRKANGGWNPCVAGNHAPYKGSVIHNCVGWTTGVINEALSVGSCKYGGDMDAERFYAKLKKQGWKASSAPVAGELNVMCWRKGSATKHSDGAGHVAPVLEVLSQTSVVTSEDGWGYTKLAQKARKKGKGNWGQNSTYTFQGFMHIPYPKVYYVVKKGDTLSGIAKKYDTSVAQIMKWNPIIKDKNKIMVGWKLRVK